MKLSLFVTTLLISASAFSAALCPIDSCNPHNGCMDGCSSQIAHGEAVCNPDEPKLAEQEAIEKGVSYAYKSCTYSFFYNSKWIVRTEATNDVCIVKAEANVSCYQ